MRPKLDDEHVEGAVFVRQVLDVADVEPIVDPGQPLPRSAPARRSAPRCRSRSPVRPSRAARIATAPLPVARSSQRSPGRGASALTSSRSTGSRSCRQPHVRRFSPHAPEHTARMGDLFADAAGRRLAEIAPLAQRLRPETLDEFVGQEHVIGPGRALRLAIERDRVPSLVLYGPPGSGKTTLARIVAHTTGSEFEELSAVSATVATVREVLARARERLGATGRRDDPLPRRDPPLQQGAAGHAAAGARGGPDHADRRDDREPLLRAELGAALADAAVRARAAVRGAAVARSSAAAPSRSASRSSPEVDRADRRAAPAAMPAPRSGSSSSPPTQRAPPGCRSRRPTSRTRRASGRCSTTRAAMPTTTSSRRGSSRRARATSRRRSTTSRRCSRAARTPASSRGG